MALTSRLSMKLTATLTKALDLVSPQAAMTVDTIVDLASGTGANQADVLFSDTRTLAASANEDLDLAASLTNALGDAATFAKVKAVLIKAASGNTNNVQVTRPAANGVPLFIAAGDGVAIPPGGAFLLVGPGAAGLCSVTGGTGDLLNVANSAAGTSVTYDIVIIGTSA